MIREPQKMFKEALAQGDLIVLCVRPAALRRRLYRYRAKLRFATSPTTFRAYKRVKILLVDGGLRLTTGD